MSEKIHENIKAAQDACKKYIAEIYAMQKDLGVWEENDDSCVTTYVYAKYYNEYGGVQTFFIA